MWEKAARGTEGQIFPWFGEWDGDHLNANETRIGQTSAVGLFPSGTSPFGVFDMAGNVYEWCSGIDTERATYPFKPRSYDHDLLLDSAHHSMRGGAFHSRAKFCRTPYRRSYHPDDRRTNLGFRVAEYPLTRKP